MFSLFGFCHCQQHGAYLLLHLFPCKSPWMLCSRNRRSQVSWWHSSFKNFHFSIKMSPLQVRGVKFESSPCPAYCCPVKTQVSFNSSQFPGNNGKRLFQRYRLRIFSIFLSKRFALKTLICLPQWFRYFCLSINVRILHFLIRTTRRRLNKFTIFHWPDIMIFLGSKSSESVLAHTVCRWPDFSREWRQEYYWQWTWNISAKIHRRERKHNTCWAQQDLFVMREWSQSSSTFTETNAVSANVKVKSTQR